MEHITENGWIDLEEFLPSGDTFVVEMLPVSTKKETETGLIISTSSDSVIDDRPNFGKIVAVGPDAKRKIGEYVYTQKTSGYDLEMIRHEEGIRYVLLYDDSIIGNLVPKDPKDPKDPKGK